MDVKKKFIFILAVCFSVSFVLCDDHHVDEVEASQPGYPGGPWQFVEDELLLVPGYTSQLSFILKLFTSTLACVGIRELRDGHGDHWFKKTLNDTIPGFICGSICAWTYETACYGFALHRFLKNWEKNRANTPEALYGFFEKEYKAFCEEGTEYIIWNTKRVIKAISSVIECRNGRLEVSICGDAEE